jgi:hypothetical protein
LVASEISAINEEKFDDAFADFRLVAEQKSHPAEFNLWLL